MALNNVQMWVKSEVLAEIHGADPCNVEVKAKSKTKVSLRRNPRVNDKKCE